ncbi:MAG: hypothetical protein AB8B55_06295, partial [Mariniblastus sp.]
MPLIIPRPLTKTLSILVAIFLCASVGEVFGQDDAGKIDFAHDIFPILKTKCANCHSNGVYKGGLSLESRHQLVDSGSVEVGSSESSDLVDR